jgi:RNA polymerase sigma factor (sigma-70 family)
MGETEKLSGQALVDAMIARDDSAWRVFLADFTPLIAGLCHKVRMTGDDIDDIVQAVVVKLLDRDCRALRKLNVTPGSLYCWVKVVVSRAIYDYFRKRECRMEHERDWVERMKEADSELVPELEAIESKVDLEIYVRGLSDEERTIFWLEYRGVPSKEIARLLGLSVSAVQQRMSRMKRKLAGIPVERESLR